MTIAPAPATDHHQPQNSPRSSVNTNPDSAPVSKSSPVQLSREQSQLGALPGVIRSNRWSSEPGEIFGIGSTLFAWRPGRASGGHRWLLVEPQTLRGAPWEKLL